MDIDMMGEHESGTDGPMATGHDVVELHLLLPARQLSALETAAARSHVTVASLLHTTIDGYLRTAATRSDSNPEAGGSIAPPADVNGFW